METYQRRLVHVMHELSILDALAQTASPESLVDKQKAHMHEGCKCS